ncbi:ATP-binding protein [Marinicella sp. W31]|uniref:ATP-binding protein n=1 Tax=Marinicella sp. W31 TaxID=3023713 RepID=UPI0037567D0C
MRGKKTDYQFSGRLFYRLYFALVVSIVVIGSGLEYMASGEDEAERLGSLMKQQKPLFETLEQLLSVHSVEEWNSVLESLTDSVDSQFILLSLQDFSADQDTMDVLQAGDMLPLYDREDDLTVYRRINNTEQVIGVLVPAWVDTFAERNWMTFVFYGLMALTVLLLMLPFSRQLLKLKAAATALGAGDLSSRIELPANTTLSPIVEAFNAMADRIERLLLAQKDLTNSVSHELRTPLARLKFGFEEIRDATEDNRIKKGVDAMQEDVRELENLVDELLKYAEISQLQELKQEALPLGTLAERLSESTEPTQGIRVEVIYADGLSAADRLWCNGHHLHRALSNVLRNGMRYAHSVCEIRIRKPQENIIITINDDGPGLDTQHAQRIFEPFYRVKSAEGHQGYGLGLAIAFNIASKHGGSLRLCQGELPGACFRFELPNKPSNKMMF